MGIWFGTADEKTLWWAGRLAGEGFLANLAIAEKISKSERPILISDSDSYFVYPERIPPFIASLQRQTIGSNPVLIHSINLVLAVLLVLLRRSEETRLYPQPFVENPDIEILTNEFDANMSRS